MADRFKEPKNQNDALAREIDRLLRKLPGADPSLRGEPVVRAQHRTPAVQAARVRAAAAAAASPPSLRAQRLGVWARVALGVGLGAAVLGWPYARACGGGLFAYLGALAAVLVSGGWAAMWSWRRRIARAHVVALVLVLWGIVLAQGEILPRIGYASRTATWTCGGGGTP